MEELVSIITPSYNSKKYFKETFDSVVNQTYKNFEWIIVDDCSTDGSYEFVKDLIKNDKRIHLYRNEKNSGAAVSRNVAIEKAKGRFIAFIDSDDLWMKEKLEKQIEFMIANNISFSYSDYYVIKKNKIFVFAPKKQCLNYKTLLKRNDIGCLTVVYDSLVIGKNYMPVEAVKREDYAAWLSIAKKNILLAKCNGLLATYRIHHSSVSNNKFKLLKYHYNVYRNIEKLSMIKSLFFLFLFSLHKILFKY